MIYKSFQDLMLSQLGMGTMRLPVLDNNDAQIDKVAAKEMVDFAFANGVNYFDTAWGYHSGNSETVVGEILSGYPRERYYLASKFPGYDLANMGKVEEIFEQQLKKCKVDYFDFYLIHNVCELNIEEYLNEEYGILDCLLEQKRNGRIRHFGFSVHGSLAVMDRFLQTYGEHMEFGQIQLNYVDWLLQDAKAKVARLNELNIPIWVMEPLRGGKLASLSANDSARLAAQNKTASAAKWAFRFLQTIPGVTTILTGASSLEQLKENIEILSVDEPLSHTEFNALQEIASEMMRDVLPCTACRYCVSHCPKGLDIPFLLELYNEHRFTGGGFLAPMALMSLDESKLPSACAGCKNCEAVCPQQLEIAKSLTDFVNLLA